MVMDKGRLHVVFGTGQVGSALAAHPGRGVAVRAVSRHRPATPSGGRPMTKDLPLAATTVKGRTRAAMTAELLAAAEAGRVRLAIGRASDFFGPGVTQGSVASPAAR